MIFFESKAVQFATLFTAFSISIQSPASAANPAASTPVSNVENCIKAGMLPAEICVTWRSSTKPAPKQGRCIEKKWLCLPPGDAGQR